MALQRKTPLRSDPAKVSAWQRRSRKPIKSSKPRGRTKAKSRPSKRSGLPTVSRKRRQQIADRRATEVPDGARQPVIKGPDHAFRKWVGSLCCAVLLGEERTRVDAAHLHCKRVNGDWIRDPNTGEISGNLMPLSRLEHGQQHDKGVVTYADTRDLDLEQLCAAIGRAYLEGWTAFAISESARIRVGYLEIDLDNPPIPPTLEAP